MLTWAESDFPRWLRARLDSEDVVQVAQLRVSHDLHKVRGDDLARLMAWARRITLRALEERIRFHERRCRDAHAETQVAIELADLGTGLGWDAGALTEALLGLPERERRIMHLRHLEGRSWREIAAELGIGPRTCRELYVVAVDELIRRLARQRPPAE